MYNKILINVKFYLFNKPQHRQLKPDVILHNNFSLTILDAKLYLLLLE